MKKVSRSLSIVLAILLVLSLALAGCGQTKPQPTTTPPASSPAGETIELAPVELTWYFPGVFPQPDQAAVFDKANQIIQSKINAKVNFMATNWGEYEDKIKVLMATSDKFDISFAASWINNFMTNQSKGAYLPLDDLLKNYAPKLFSSIENRYWDGIRINGKIYGVINQQIFARSTVFEVNKELADKYGLDPDKITHNLRDLESFLIKIKENEKNIIPTLLLWETLYENQGIETLTGKTPGAIRLNDADPKVFNQYDSPEYVEFIKFTKEWGDKGYFGGDQLISMKDYNSLVPEKKLACWTGGTYKPGGEAESSAKWGYDVYARPVSDAFITTYGLTATIMTINRNAANPERAMMLLELMNDPADTELYNLICFGIEGQHYTKKSEKSIELVKDSKYSLGTAWEFGNTFNAYLVPGQPENVWEETKALNSNAKTSPIIGFTFNPEPVKSEISQCNSVVEEYLKGFDLGLLDINTDYQAFLSKLNKAGQQKIIDEMQKQLDEFVATK